MLGWCRYHVVVKLFYLLMQPDYSPAVLEVWRSPRTSTVHADQSMLLLVHIKGAGLVLRHHAAEFLAHRIVVLFVAYQSAALAANACDHTSIAAATTTGFRSSRS
uniref:Putative secreted protein n=1 Tax=Anopheles triannulatus TaxID=58253 RepID=A0A2M4B4F4_9DIPT